MDIFKDGEPDQLAAAEVEAFLCPDPIDLTGMYRTANGATLELASRAQADALAQRLVAGGWTASVRDIWPRYSFTCPPNIAQRLTTEQIMRGFTMRNRNLPDDSLRFVSRYVVPEEEGPTRTLFWVDVNPRAVDELRRVEFWLRTTVGFVRLKEVPHRRQANQ